MMDAVAPGRTRVLYVLALLATLAALLLHASVYRFITDDAFISFRYASNFAAGRGLVFNPGLERVEGYTNFLWVVLLGAVERLLGVAPDQAANPLLLTFTVGLWALVAREALRARETGEPWWPALIAPALLAATRSVAVWSTSGLETRLFELLVVAAVFRLLFETRTPLATRLAPFPISGLLFALATLTRPDGGLIAVCALLAVWAANRDSWRSEWRSWILRALLFALPVLIHLLWRHAYYGEWLPNTWFAKVGGRTWWTMGGMYVATFALEYGALLWFPALALALFHHRRRGTLRVPLVYAAAVAPHLLYIARIGGDHFEYRPFDLYFPFLFLLIGDGVREARQRISTLVPRRRRWWMAGGMAYAALALLGLTWIPWQAHRQFPDRFIPGFPGLQSGELEAATYLNPSRDPLLRWPVLRPIAELHLRLLHATTSRLAGIRAEEHRLFVEAAEETGRKLRALAQEGILPADTHIAVSAAGVVPYRSGLRTLDRLGLNDRVVARSALTEPRMVGHERYATLAYAARIGVDLWAEDPVHLLFSFEDERLAVVLDGARRYERDVYYAYAAEDVIVALLPRGAEAAVRRFPALDFHSLLRDPEAGAELEARVAEGTRRRLAARPHSVEARVAAAVALADGGDVAGAIRALEELSEAEDPRILAGLADLQMRVGRYQEAARLLRQAARVAPGLRGLHFNLGVALANLERWEEARSAFRAAVELEPADPQLRYQLGATCYILDDLGCAQEQVTVLRRMGTESAAAWAESLSRALTSP